MQFRSAVIAHSSASKNCLVPQGDCYGNHQQSYARVCKRHSNLKFSRNVLVVSQTFLGCSYFKTLKNDAGLKKRRLWEVNVSVTGRNGSLPWPEKKLEQLEWLCRSRLYWRSFLGLSARLRLTAGLIPVLLFNIARLSRGKPINVHNWFLACSCISTDDGEKLSSLSNPMVIEWRGQTGRDDPLHFDPL